MGNEAGDLDSVASSIAYSYLNSLRDHPTIALIQTPRPDVILPLRAENLHAFAAAKLSPDHDDILCIDDLPVPPSALTTTFALVDHNSLLPLWADRPAGAPEAKVVGIVDHHEDEKKHLDASPREIAVPLGSCASLVAKVFGETWTNAIASSSPPPPELATLLLSAIYIDTGGLKGSKTEALDIASGTFLEHIAHNMSSVPGGTGDAGALGASANITAWRDSLAEDLSSKKSDVSHLSSYDLLRRDYKDYIFTSSDGKKTAVGLSTVPVGLKAWLAKDPTGFRPALEAWARERKLDVVGVLNTFRTENKHKHRRELLLLIGAAPETSLSVKSEENVNELVEALAQGLESKPILELEKVKLKDELAAIKGVEGDEQKGIVKVWKQGNAKATRKIIGPIFREILEGVPATVPADAQAEADV
jgi:exopolyphosphatase